jgi:hypothetical protein
MSHRVRHELESELEKGTSAADKAQAVPSLRKIPQKGSCVRIERLLKDFLGHFVAAEG